jgi:hypothetical protein
MDGNNPDGIAETALSVDEAADQLTGLFSDDPDEDTVALADTDDADDAGDDADDIDAEDADDEDGDEAEDAEDDAEDEDDSEPEAVALNDDLEITLDDGSKTTLKELKLGNLRQADYTRKTQEIAATKREFEGKSQQIESAAGNLVQQFEVLETVLQDAVPPRPTAQQFQEDPFGAQQAQAAYFEAQERLQQVQGQLQQARQHQQALEQQKAAEKQQSALRELVEWRPDLQDMSKRVAFGQELIAAAANYGFAPNDFNEIWDVRIIKALADAKAYQELKSKAPQTVKKAKKAPPVTTPKQRQSQGAKQNRAVRKRLDALRKSGDVADAAKVFEQFID